MIKFSCTCHTVLEVSNDFAGSSLQCPKCKRLLDVPTLSDLNSLAEDGGFKLDDVKMREDPNRLADLQRVYSRNHHDRDGNEKDLRGQFGIHDAPIPLGDDDVLEVVNEEPITPKYDPVTGELVRDIALKSEPKKFDPNTIPMAHAIINYASASDTSEFNGWRIIPAMFRYENLFVIIIVAFVHGFLQLMMAPVAAGLLIVLPGLIVILMGLFGHYANVVEDIGFEGKDELPRPLRDVSLYDDIWRPFINMSLAILVCYGPLMFTSRFPKLMAFAFAGTIVVMGTLLFPAVLLTTTSSGTVMNLAPHKLLRVISTLGAKYLIAILLWMLTIAIYFTGIIGTMYPVAKLLTSFSGTWGKILLPLVFAYPVLIMGIMMAHGFCWYLGLQYRQHHDEFAWYLQRHYRKLDMIKSPSGILVPAPNKPVAPLKPPPLPKSKSAPAPVQPLPAQPIKRYPQSHA